MSNLRVLSNKQTLPWVSWLRWQPGDLQPIWGGKKQNKKLRIKPPTSFPPSVTDWGKLDGDRQRMSHRHSPYLSSCERLLKNGIERGSVKTQLTAWVPAKPTPNFSPLHHISSNTTIMNTNLQTLEQWSAILNIQYMCVCVQGHGPPWRWNYTVLAHPLILCHCVLCNMKSDQRLVEMWFLS